MKKIKNIIKRYCCEKLFLQINQIKKMILNPKIKVISFDIFDTLLVRPSIYPTDLFSLVSEDFVLLRKNAESYCDVNCTLYDIWDAVCDRNYFDNEKKKYFINTEIQLEKQLLYPRKMILDLYELAVKNNKRIIAVSDMYIPGALLKEILFLKGYKKIDMIYVSCDCKCRKSNGMLFEHVLKEEGINNKQIIHIGDNLHSDYKIPQKIGITSFYIPSNYRLFLLLYAHQNYIFVNSDARFRVVIGYAINRIFECNTKKLGVMNLDIFSDILLFPLLTKITYDFLNKNELKDYDKYYFIARDGYLPILAYNAIKTIEQKPAEYLYASRLSYNCLFDEDIYMHAKRINSKNVTIEQYLSTIVFDNDIAKEICDSLSSEERNQEATYFNLKKVLFSKKVILDQFFKEKKEACRKYFSGNVIVDNKNSKRILVFDCGYSGSISNSISCALDNKVKVDKYYLHGNDINKSNDQKNGTKTFEVFTKDVILKYDLLWETLLSSVDGTCLGYDIKNLQPVLNKSHYDKTSKQLIMYIQNRALESIVSFNQMLGEYSMHFNINDVTQLYDVINNILSQNTQFARQLEKIKFNDDFYSTYNLGLENIIIDFKHPNNQLYRFFRIVRRLYNHYPQLKSR